MNDTTTVEVTSEQLKAILNETDDQFKIVPLSEEYEYDYMIDKDCYRFDAEEISTGNVYRFRYWYEDPDCYYLGYDDWTGHLIG